MLCITPNGSQAYQIGPPDILVVNINKEKPQSLSASGHLQIEVEYEQY